MGRVSVLPDALANQIAAGEVVERPASVVKELVENALDAEATRVFVAVSGGGQALVRVLDDGLGMSRDDAVLSLQRHATSKIHSADDLHGIDTLGFRGEALPSIASVSRFRLITRERDAADATEVSVEGGAAPVVKDAAAPPGTRIEVVDLFYNVPARLKFLKQPATEMTHVAALMTAFALGHPHVHFRLDKDGRTAADYPVAKRLDQRIFQVLGKGFAGRLHPVGGDGPIRIRGYISEPGFTRTNQHNIHTFVNGRRVRDRIVTHALIAAYGELLQRGHFPQGVLYVHLDPQLIDVNVHPAKAEIRFIDGGAVHEAIVRAVRTTLHAAPWRNKGLAPLLDGPASPAPPAGPSYPPRASTALPLFVGDGPAPYATPSLPHRSTDYRPSPYPQYPDAALHRSIAATAEPPEDRPPEPAAGAGEGFVATLRLVGQVGRAWLVCEGGGALVLVDQAAASALLVTVALRAALDAPSPPSQPLLFPLQVELDAGDQAAANAHVRTLRRLGLDLEPFGGRTWQLIALPASLAHAAPEALVAAALGAVRASTSDAEGLAPGLIAALATLAPVRAGQLL
ncbi:MAG: DNA mismatch repair protein MutL, partial [Deltaproteobacteria bacterium HGW-Deltaproteobacteria-14]